MKHNKRNIMYEKWFSSVIKHIHAYKVYLISNNNIVLDFKFK